MIIGFVGWKCTQFDISSNETIENFVNKYLTTDFYFILVEICSWQIH
jgi:hypothetical protein